MKKAPEQFRLKKHQLLGSDASYGNNGYFLIPHPKVSGYTIGCMISNGQGWEHVSVTIMPPNKKVSRCPTWEEMCFVKDMFFEKDETVIQYHPQKSEYISNHPYCLHLWKPVGIEIPLPPSIMVGLKELNGKIEI